MNMEGEIRVSTRTFVDELESFQAENSGTAKH